MIRSRIWTNIKKICTIKKDKVGEILLLDKRFYENIRNKWSNHGQALIQDGEVLFGHSERYSGVKNDSDLNKQLMGDCFRYGKN